MNRMKTKIDRTEKIDKRWKELKKFSKDELWSIYALNYKVFSKDKCMTKLDLMNDIIDIEYGWKHYYGTL